MFRSLIITSALVPALMGCAVVAPPDYAGSRSPAEMTLINDTCGKVMGLGRGETYYLYCQESLAHSLAERDEAYANVSSGEACRDRGLVSGSAAYATCVLDTKSASKPPAIERVSFTSAALQPGKDYYSVTPTIQFQRKQFACAQLGLTPGGALFGGCVAGLEGALMPTDP